MEDESSIISSSGRPANHSLIISSSGIRFCLSLSFAPVHHTAFILCFSFMYKYLQERGGWGLIFPPAPESPFDVGRLLGVRATCLLVAWVVVVLQTFQSALGF